MPYLAAFVIRFFRIIWFSFYVLYEIFVANFKVAYAILMPGSRFNPGLFQLPLECKTSVEITLLVNIISLTPGTLALEVNEHKKELLVHTMFYTTKEALIEELKSHFEQPILKIFN